MPILANQSLHGVLRMSHCSQVQVVRGSSAPFCTQIYRLFIGFSPSAANDPVGMQDAAIRSRRFREAGVLMVSWFQL